MEHFTWMGFLCVWGKCRNSNPVLYLFCFGNLEAVTNLNEPEWFVPMEATIQCFACTTYVVTYTISFNPHSNLQTLPLLFRKLNLAWRSCDLSQITQITQLLSGHAETSRSRLGTLFLFSLVGVHMGRLLLGWDCGGGDIAGWAEAKGLWLAGKLTLQHSLPLLYNLLSCLLKYQIGGLKTTEMYFLTTLEAGSLRLKYRQVQFLLRPLPSACRWPSSCRILTWASFCTCLCPDFLVL